MPEQACRPPWVVEGVVTETLRHYAGACSVRPTLGSVPIVKQLVTCIAGTYKACFVHDDLEVAPACGVDLIRVNEIQIAGLREELPCRHLLGSFGKRYLRTAIDSLHLAVAALIASR